MIIARLIKRIEVGLNYKVKIEFRINVEQHTGSVA